jgi:M6 family metalloprotease-like protein
MSACDLTNAGTRAPNEGETDTRIALPSTGQLRATMIFVDFPDAPADESTADLHSLLVPPAQTWFDEVSYGRLDLQVNARHQWFRMPRSSGAYGLADGASFAEHHRYVADAMKAADGVVDFSGREAVYIVSSSGAAIPGSPVFQAYAGQGVRADGNEIRHAVTFGNNVRVAQPDYAAHVLVHGTGLLLGLPDVYRFGRSTFSGTHSDVGGWDTMGWVRLGAHFTAWHKRKLGWLDRLQSRCVANETAEAVLTPLDEAGGTKAVIAPITRSVAYVAEVRRRAGQDSRLCDEGVLVYRIDATAKNGSGGMRVMPAAGGSDATCGPLAHAPFDVGADEIDTFTDPGKVTIRVLEEAGGAFRIRVTSRVQPAPDREAPKMAVSVARRQASGRTGVLGGMFRCIDEGCVVRIDAQIAIPGVRKPARFHPIVTRAARDTNIRMRLRISGKTRDRIRLAVLRGQPVRAWIRLTVRDDAGNTRRVLRRVRITG